MVGILVKALAKTDFDFSGVGTTPMVYPASDLIPSLGYREGILVARVHSKSTTSILSQSLDIVVQGVSRSNEDPSNEFMAHITSLGFPIHGGTSGAQPPGFSSFSGNPITAAVRVFLSVSQTTPGSLFRCSVSVDLVLRE